MFWGLGHTRGHTVVSSTVQAVRHHSLGASGLSARRQLETGAAG
jgi:hypothetical protein